MGGPRILVVEDDPLLVFAWRRTATALSLTVEIAPDVAAASAILDAGRVDALVADFRLGGETSTELVRSVCLRDPRLPIVVLTGDPNAAALALGDAVAIYSKARVTPKQVVCDLLRCLNAPPSRPL